MAVQNRQLYALIGLVVLIAAAWSGILDTMARDYATDGILQAGAFYGALRLLNAIVSMFQEVEINFMVSQLAIGQLLDPINDLVEYVSSGLKIALGSYLLQRVIIEVVSTSLFNAIFTLAAIMYTATWFGVLKRFKNGFFKMFITLVFFRFSIVLLMLATTAFSSAFLDDKIEEERARTQRLSSELNETKKAASDISEELANTIRADLNELERKKSDIAASVTPRRDEVREARYAISRKEKMIEEIKRGMGVVDGWKGNERIDELESQIDALESRISVVEQEIEELNDKMEFVNGEIEAAEAHLYEKSSGLVKMMMQGVDSAWDYISGLSQALTNSAMTGLMLFFFKMLFLPIFFLFVLIKFFRYVWTLDLPEVKLVTTAGDQASRETTDS